MEPLIRDPRLRKLTFTGSTAGRASGSSSSPPSSCCGCRWSSAATRPFLVFEDADVDAAVDGAMLAKMRNIGEACTAANRFYRARVAGRRVRAGLAARMGALTVGKGTKEGVDVGPLVDEPRPATRSTSSSRTPSPRAPRCSPAGRPVGRRGYFYEPTVLADVPADGPAACARRSSARSRPITTFAPTTGGRRALANDTEYGLVAYVFTSDLTRAITRERGASSTGMVGVNAGIVSNPAAPFGGVKQSGFGREGGFEGIDEYLETKYVGIAL